MGVGASAGGLAFDIVLHLSAEHDSCAASILPRATAMPLRQVTQSEPIRIDHVCVIAPALRLQMDDTQPIVDVREDPPGQPIASTASSGRWGRPWRAVDGDRAVGHLPAPRPLADMHRRSMQADVDASLLVDSQGTLFFSGTGAARYPKHVTGEPSRDVLEMVVPALAPALRAALLVCRDRAQRVVTRPVSIADEQGPIAVYMIVGPVSADPGAVSRAVRSGRHQPGRRRWGRIRRPRRADGAGSRDTHPAGPAERHHG